VEELVPEWGWRRDKGSWFQRHGEAYRKERSVILREDDVGGRARLTTDEERVHIAANGLNLPVTAGWAGIQKDNLSGLL